MTGVTYRKAAGLAILHVVGAVLVALVTVLSDPWWMGPVTIGGALALAWLIAYAICLVMDE